MLKRIAELESENIESFSFLSRFSRKQKEKRELTDLNKVIEDALGLTSTLAGTSNVVIKKVFEDNLPLVMADKGQMQEVLVVLLLNSLEAMPKKGKLTIKTSYLKKDNHVELVLSDTGSGTEQDYLKRIAEPFFNDKETMQGAGLGFSIAYEIVARHKGKMDIESTPGKGTTVIIRLPAA